jgi:HPt (histidine-containing phosphotransfer) domain-containing protein
MNAVIMAFEAKDYSAADKAMHKLKGTAGNLSVKAVFELSTAMMEKIKREAGFETLGEDLQKLRDSFSYAKNMYLKNIDEVINYGKRKETS